MEMQDLIKILKDESIAKIQFENYKGDFACWIQDFDIADIETSEYGNILRLQINDENLEIIRK